MFNAWSTFQTITYLVKSATIMRTYVEFLLNRHIFGTLKPKIQAVYFRPALQYHLKANKYPKAVRLLYEADSNAHQTCISSKERFPQPNASVVVLVATSMCFKMYADINMHIITPDLSQIPMKVHEASSPNRSR
jgi:hypothetical protein